MVFSTTLVVALVLAFLVASTASYIYSRCFSRCALPSSLPWSGVDDDKWFSRARATLRSFLHTRELVFEGYGKVSRSVFAGHVFDLVAVLKERPPVCPPHHHHRARSYHPHVTSGVVTETERDCSLSK